ncbi:hypothetical protein JKP88DRAFT_225795 [Tribonema minus]|uniref:Uncharacterized protein n=1 Tax=Tribonema minus TaxID=303371 RepID=A0A835YR12_9STRA|nr:hypothetical protein JKP88DRAFT_225795 [Tribonema minus]
METEVKAVAPVASKPQGKPKKGKGKAKAKAPAAKASDAFVSTKKRAGDLMAGEPPSFLDELGATLWKELVVAPRGKPIAPTQGPFSRAYRSFTAKGEGVTVHMGGAFEFDEDDAADRAPAPPDLEKKAALRLYQSTLGAAVAAAGTVEPTMSTVSNVAMKARLTRLYLKQLAMDLKPRVASNPDFDPKRFPATAARIMA